MFKIQNVNLRDAWNILSEKYLWWDNDVLTQRNSFLPVIKLLEVHNHNGEEFIKIEYFADLSGKTLMNFDMLPANTDYMTIVALVDKKMSSCEWYNKSSFYRNTYVQFLPLPNCHAKLNEPNKDGAFNIIVSADEECIDCFPDCMEQFVTKTVLDIFVYTEHFTLFKWYDFQFESYSTCIPELHVGSNKNRSLILYGSFNSWSIAMSTYDPANNALLSKSYEVKPMSNRHGISFMIKNFDIKRIWFKIAWIKASLNNDNDCEAALRTFIG